MKPRAQGTSGKAVAASLVALAAALVVAAPRPAQAAPLKVACLGTSAMAGYGSSAGHHISDEMARALGPGYEVKNFAVVGVTALRKTDVSYWNRPELKAAQDYNPDIVLFWFGGNDTFVQYWDAHKAEFQGDYTDLVHLFQALPSHPKTFLIRLLVFGNGPVQKAVVENEILPTVGKIATATGSFLINYHDTFLAHPEYFPDGFHPNDTGTALIGPYFAKVIGETLAAAPDGGTGDAAAADAGGQGGASGEDAPSAVGSGGAPGAVPDASSSGGGAGGASTGTGGASGSGGAIAPPAGTGGAAGPPGQSGGGGCRVSGHSTPSRIACLVVLALLVVAARRGKRRR